MIFPCKFIIYRLRCRKTMKSYVGFTTTTIDRRWLNHLMAMRRAMLTGKSITYLWKAINLYGIDCWDKDMLFTGLAGSKDDIVQEEIKFISSEGTLAPGGYNLTAGGEGRVGCVCSAATKEKLRKIHLGMKPSAATRQKMSAAQRGRVFSPEHRVKLSASEMGSKNHRFGKHMSSKLKYRLSQRNSGKGNPFYGRTHSLDSIRKIKQNQKLRFGSCNPSSRAVRIGRTRFDTMKSAAAFIGVSVAVLRSRLESIKWPKYRYV